MYSADTFPRADLKHALMLSRRYHVDKVEARFLEANSYFFAFSTRSIHTPAKNYR
jgi:hypothetical protein